MNLTDLGDDFSSIATVRLTFVKYLDSYQMDCPKLRCRYSKCHDVPLAALCVGTLNYYEPRS